MIDLRSVNQSQYIAAKRYWALAFITKIILFILGAWTVFLDPTPLYMPQILLGLAVLSEILQLRSDAIKGQAESLLRILDMCQSFGRQISEADKRDIVANVPQSTRKRFSRTSVSDPYFVSIKKDGPHKAIENLLESAWYTRHQTNIMAIIYTIFITILIITSIVVLIITVREVSSIQLREQIVKVVTAWLLLIVSLNMLKSAWSYYKMYNRCQRTELICHHLLLGSVSEADAIKQWHEYQLARNSSPLLPEWLWKLIGRSLDDAWKRASNRNP